MTTQHWGKPSSQQPKALQGLLQTQQAALYMGSVQLMVVDPGGRGEGLTVGLDVALVALDVVNLGGVEDLC